MQIGSKRGWLQASEGDGVTVKKKKKNETKRKRVTFWLFHRNAAVHKGDSVPQWVPIMCGSGTPPQPLDVSVVGPPWLTGATGITTPGLVGQGAALWRYTGAQLATLQSEARLWWTYETIVRDFDLSDSSRTFIGRSHTAFHKVWQRTACQSTWCLRAVNRH